MARDWERAYQINDTPWDKGYAAPPLAAYLETHRIRGDVLVPGSGTGHDVRLLAAQGATVIGLDIAPGAITRAESFPRAGAEVYRCGDFLDLAPPLAGRFDWVVEHTCLCALEPAKRGAYATSVSRALKPGGHLFGVFFRNVPNFDGEGPPFPISEVELTKLFEPLFERIHSFVPESTYPGRPFGCEEVRILRKPGVG